MRNDEPLFFGFPIGVLEAEAASEGKKTPPRKFEATIYTGGELEFDTVDLPVIIDLASLKTTNVLVANLDHKKEQRVGNFELNNDGKTLVAHGTATAKTAARDEVVGSADDGYQWQASVEFKRGRMEKLKAGATAVVNGQTFTGPKYISRGATIRGFGFVSHGADDNTSATLAANAANSKEYVMVDEKVKAFAASLGVNELTEEQVPLFAAALAKQIVPKPPEELALEAAAKQAEELKASKEAAVKAATERSSKIAALCAQAKCPELAAGLISDEAATMEVVKDKILAKMLAAGAPVGEGGVQPEGDGENAKYKAEYAANTYLKASMKEADYIASRRIDDGLDSLTPKTNAA